jgi:hypothetical protein
MVLLELRSLNKNKSPGGDGLHPLILSLIYTASYREAEVPVAWKEGNITAIYKKGKKTEPANYRPITLTVIPYKKTNG